MWGLKSMFFLAGAGVLAADEYSDAPVISHGTAWLVNSSAERSNEMTERVAMTWGRAKAISSGVSPPCGLCSCARFGHTSGKLRSSRMRIMCTCLRLLYRPGDCICTHYQALGESEIAQYASSWRPVVRSSGCPIVLVWRYVWR